MCGGASGIFSSPPPPEDFKWNSPENYFLICYVYNVLLLVAHRTLNSILDHISIKCVPNTSDNCRAKTHLINTINIQTLGQLCTKIHELLTFSKSDGKINISRLPRSMPNAVQCHSMSFTDPRGGLKD